MKQKRKATKNNTYKCERVFVVKVSLLSFDILWRLSILSCQLAAVLQLVVSNKLSNCNR